MKNITAVLLGAGSRGYEAYAPYALSHPDEISFIAVAEPDVEKRERFAKTYHIDDEMCFDNWEKLLELPKLADAAIICTQDRMHFAPTVKALGMGYHVLLEKPMSGNQYECIVMGEAAKKYDRVFSICHVLRYTDFFTKIKMLLDQGKIGRLISMQHNENVGYWHQAHSFVRGNWRNSDESSPMILAKCCHDMDIMLWLAGADCVKLSSFGSLTHFKRENAPAGAPARCLDGCSAESECPYYAPKLYLNGNTGWPANVVSMDTSREALTKALKEGPYGRCVYRCDNNVVDHQVVNIEFANEVTAAFTMCAFTGEISRTLKLMGTKGEIRACMEKNEIEVTEFSTGTKETIKLNESKHGHGGGDYGIMRDFVRLVAADGMGKGRTSADISVQSHLMAFASEISRLENRVVFMNDFRKELESGGIASSAS